MKVNSFISEKKWNNFLKERKGSFLQSVEWGNFKKKYQKVERLQAEKDGEIKGICQFFKEKNKLVKYFYIPYGPVSVDKETSQLLLKKVLEKAEQEKVSLVKIEPVEEVDLGVASYHRIQPRKTAFLDIKDDPDHLLKKFRKSTRYNIRQALKKGVEVEKTKTVDYFFNILQETKKRQSFSTYSKDYFQDLTEKNSCDIFIAKHQGEVIAGSIVLYFGDVATYLHSAFDYQHQDLNATALIVFESIKQAKENGCKYYDFWGLDEKKYLGVTKFKKGFKGKEFFYKEVRDIPLKKGRYFIYYLASIIKMHLK